MKIKLIIDEKYSEPEIHICNEEKNDETDRLAQLVSQAVSTTITGYTYYWNNSDVSSGRYKNLGTRNSIVWTNLCYAVYMYTGIKRSY